jgi:hypothetical protein
MIAQKIETVANPMLMTALIAGNLMVIMVLLLMCVIF